MITGGADAEIPAAFTRVKSVVNHELRQLRGTLRDTLSPMVVKLAVPADSTVSSHLCQVLSESDVQYLTTKAVVGKVPTTQAIKAMGDGMPSGVPPYPMYA